MPEESKKEEPREVTGCNALLRCQELPAKFDDMPNAAHEADMVASVLNPRIGGLRWTVGAADTSLSYPRDNAPPSGSEIHFFARIRIAVSSITDNRFSDGYLAMGRRKGDLPGRFVNAHLRRNPHQPQEYVNVAEYQERVEASPSKLIIVDPQGKLDLTINPEDSPRQPDEDE